VLQNLPLRLDECKKTPDELLRSQLQNLGLDSDLSARNPRPKVLIASVHSMKTIPHFTNFYIWAAQSFDSASSNLQQLFDVILNVFSKFQPDTLKHIKNIPLYIDYLDTSKHLLNFLNFALKRMPQRQQQTIVDYYVEKFPKIFNIKILLLKNMP
jgi:hypothetical protein